MFIDFIIPPAFPMLLGALILPFVTKKYRSAAFIAFPILSLYLIFSMPKGAEISVFMMNYTLLICKADALSKVFGIIFAFIAACGGIYAFHLKDTGQQCAALLYAGGALAVTYAGDFFTLFIFWELMAIASTYLIWARRTEAAAHSGFRYLLYHVLGGGLLFSGLILHISAQQTITIATIAQDGSLASWLILLGVAVNAAIPPLSTWLSDAYPQGTVTGSVFLSAFTTKTAVYVLIRLFPGYDILLIAGVIMTLYGVIFAVLSNDIRGILAYHIISQVGYMVAGVGLGTELALNGTVAHAFCHILYKALLFMGTGVVLQTTGKSKLHELGGLYQRQKLNFWLFFTGAMSISGFPLFNGFISKSMIIAAAGESHYQTAMLLLLLASVGTFLSIGLKIAYFTWFGKDCGLQPSPAPVNMPLAMAIVAFCCLLLGVFPALIYQWLPFPVSFNAYTIPHLSETIQILIFTFLAFWLLRHKLHSKPKLILDTDWFYRRPKLFFKKLVVDSTETVFNYAEKTVFSITHALIYISANPYRLFPGHKDNAYSPNLYRSPSQTLIIMVLITFIILAIIKIFVR